MDQLERPVDPAAGVFASRREQTLAEAGQALERENRANAVEATTLLGGLFGWWDRLRRKKPASMPQEPAAEQPAEAPVSVWQAMPRTNVDAPPVTPLSTAAAAAAPFAEALAAASAPVRKAEENPRLDLPELPAARATQTIAAAPAARPVAVPPPARVAPSAPFASEAAAAPVQTISFGKRAGRENLGPRYYWRRG